MTARETLDGIRARYEASQQALANDSKTVSIRIAHRLSESANDVPRLSNAVEAVLALAEQWEARGEHDMAYSKTVPDEDIAMELLADGAAKVENARHIRNAVENALKEGQ